MSKYCFSKPTSVSILLTSFSGYWSHPCCEPIDWSVQLAHSLSLHTLMKKLITYFHILVFNTKTSYQGKVTPHLIAL
jgi:hypothetical protein